VRADGLRMEELSRTERGQPGLSARREAARRRKEQSVWSYALRGEPQSTRAWDIGAKGEERVGRRLERLQGGACVVLHDRSLGHGNIDHLVCTPRGVWVVDTKNYTGRVEARRRARQSQLFVRGRHATALVDGVERQVDAVQAALDVGTPVRGALCFWNAEWGALARPFVVNGVLVTWPRALVKAIGRPNARDNAATSIASRLAATFPRAAEGGAW
jgi:Nuclease-related domain